MLDWQRVGLDAPTDDPARIQRAYAATLRATRPDDDALAYQALREAYDRLMQRARKRVRIRLDEARVDPPPPTPGVGDDVASPSGAAADAASPSGAAPPIPSFRAPTRVDAWTPRAEAVAPVPSGPTPDALCRDVLDAVAQGRAALDALTPRLVRALDALPLQRKPEASLRFADLVIECDALPQAMLQALEHHFGWLDDFRAMRLLGAERAQALAHALASVPRTIDDPVIARRFAEPIALAPLIARGVSVKLRLLVLLLGHALTEQLEAAGPGLLRRMGLDAAEMATVRELSKAAFWIANGIVVPIVFGIAYVQLQDAGAAFALTLGAAGIVLVWALCSLALIGTVIQLRALELVNAQGRIARLPFAQRASALKPWTPWIGAALVAVAAPGMSLPAPLGDPSLVLVAGGAAVLGLVLAFPSKAQHALTAIALQTLACATIRADAAIGAAVAAWILAGTHLHAQRIVDVDGLARAGPSMRPRTLAAWALLATVGLPTLVAWAADRFGYRLVVAAVVMAFATHIQPPGTSMQTGPSIGPTIVRDLAALTIALAASVAAQRIARRLAGRWLGLHRRDAT